MKISKQNRIIVTLIALAIVIGVGILLDKQFGLDAYPVVSQDEKAQTSPEFANSKQDEGAGSAGSADAMSAGARERLIIFGNTRALPSYEELVSSWETYQGALFELSVEVISVVEPQAREDCVVYARYSANSENEITLRINRQMYVEKAHGTMTTFCSFEGIENDEPLFLVRSYSCE